MGGKTSILCTIPPRSESLPSVAQCVAAQERSHKAMRQLIAWASLAATLLLAATPLATAGSEDEPPCEPVYRLYRNWAPGVQRTGRVHIATFDSCQDGSVAYNEAMCDHTRRLYQSQPGVRVVFWCELVDLR